MLSVAMNCVPRSTDLLLLAQLTRELRVASMDRHRQLRGPHVHAVLRMQRGCFQLCEGGHIHHTQNEENLR